MRLRNTAVYLLILLLVGGYFYYFEVVKKEQKEAAEKDARRLFSFGAEELRTIEVSSGKARPVRLENTDGWMLTEPAKSEIDKPTLDIFMGELRSLESVRKMGTQENLAPYGLDDPPLKIRFQIGDRWMELLVGTVNPAGDARYAKIADSADIFLINQSVWQTLNKSFKDFRKKDLFSWRGDQVTAIKVDWRSGEKVKLERRGDSNDWQASGLPELKIKPAKMESLLNKIQWLRATDFLEEGARPNPPSVKLTFRLRDGQTVELALGEPDAASNQVVASSPGLPVPVKVPSQFFAEIPKSADALRDLSLFPREPRDVRELKWKKSGAEGSAVKSDAAKWTVKAGSGSKMLDEPWPVDGLLEDLAHIEYSEKVEGASVVPESGTNFLELLGPERKMMSMAWSAMAEGEKGEVTIRLETDGGARLVRIKADDLRNVEEDLEELAKTIQAK